MKRLGQHFLTSKTIAKRIAHAASITLGDVVLEVGPGKGMLTDAILAKNPKKIIAVEKDGKLAAFLKEKYKNEKRIEIVEDDIRKFLLKPNCKLLTTHYKLVSNIPYYLTSHLIRILLENCLTKPKFITLTVQKEVAKRVTARPPHMNLLALSVQSMGAAKKIFSVSRKYFTPQPKVDSAVIVIENISEKFFKNIEKEEFFALLHAGFAQKRKLLAGNIAKKTKIPRREIENIFTSCNINPKARAENLSLEQWRCLHLRIHT